MDSTVFNLVWQGVLRRQYCSANAIDKTKYPEISQQALDEVAEFGRLPPPDSGHELNVRRVRAHLMQVSWETK